MSPSSGYSHQSQLVMTWNTAKTPATEEDLERCILGASKNYHLSDNLSNKQYSMITTVVYYYYYYYYYYNKITRVGSLYWKIQARRQVKNTENTDTKHHPEKPNNAKHSQTKLPRSRVQSPFATLSQETRWAYSTTLRVHTLNTLQWVHLACILWMSSKQSGSNSIHINLHLYLYWNLLNSSL